MQPSSPVYQIVRIFLFLLLAVCRDPNQDNLFPSPPYLNPTIPPGDLGSDPEDNRNKDTSKSASKECPAVDLHPDDDGVVGDNDQVVYYAALWF